MLRGRGREAERDGESAKLRRGRSGETGLRYFTS